MTSLEAASLMTFWRAPWPVGKFLHSRCVAPSRFGPSPPLSLPRTIFAVLGRVTLPPFLDPPPPYHGQVLGAWDPPLVPRTAVRVYASPRGNWPGHTCSEILGIYLYLLVPDPWHLSRRDKTCPVSKSRHLSRQDKINGSVSQKNAPRAVRAMVKKKNGSRI